jgi:hypothetical protein
MFNSDYYFNRSRGESLCDKSRINACLKVITISNEAYNVPPLADLKIIPVEKDGCILPAAEAAGDKNSLHSMVHAACFYPTGILLSF